MLSLMYYEEQHSIHMKIESNNICTMLALMYCEEQHSTHMKIESNNVCRGVCTN